MMLLLQWVLWCSVAAVAVVAIGYPVFLALSKPFARRWEARDDYEPSVTLVIAAYNEEAVIRAKLTNSLALDYPREKLEIVVASDGSSDRTNPIVQEFAGLGISLAAFPRTGKTGMQNRMAQQAAGDILIFSDANAMYRADAIRKLVRNFADATIGGVCGQLVYAAEGEGAGSSERLYWGYEKFMKRRESELSSVVGANGSIYAVRRTDYVTIDEDLISDLVEPLAIVRNGRRVVYEPEAISVERASANYGTEFRRKVRILTRSIRSLLRVRELLNPFRFGIFSVQLGMHKLLRFIAPVFLITAAISLVSLATMGKYLGLLGGAALMTGLSMFVAVGRTGASSSVFSRPFHLIYYYLMANYALTLAWINVFRGQRMTLWAPERTSP
jgi:cellulose synthase/poly-beta-1,6-N-acetylglucosamine synthase-like glycosyltransferase